MDTVVEVVTIRAARLNFRLEGGDAWAHEIQLTRGGSPINLTNAVIVTRFRPGPGATETTLTYAATSLAQGRFTIGQSTATAGTYAVKVTEVGATARTMLKGTIETEQVV